MRTALRAGAQVEFADGRLIVKAPTEITVGPPPTVPEPRAPRSEPNNPGYVAMKAALAERGINSHVSHIGASLAVLHGIRIGDYMPGTDALLRFMNENIDSAILASCCVRAVNLKHSIKVRGKRISLSTAALGAAMYAAMDLDAHADLDTLEPIVAGTAMERKAKELAAEADKYGGHRTIEYRRVSYSQFLDILTQKEI